MTPQAFEIMLYYVFFGGLLVCAPLLSYMLYQEKKHKKTNHSLWIYIPMLASAMVVVSSFCVMTVFWIFS